MCYKKQCDTCESERVGWGVDGAIAYWLGSEWKVIALWVEKVINKVIKTVESSTAGCYLPTTLAKGQRPFQPTLTEKRIHPCVQGLSERNRQHLNVYIFNKAHFHGGSQIRTWWNLPFSSLLRMLTLTCQGICEWNNVCKAHCVMLGIFTHFFSFSKDAPTQEPGLLSSHFVV